MPAGGIMFENILKRLCPCYFNNKHKGDSPACQTSQKKTSKLMKTSRNITSGSTNTATTTSTVTTQDSWKGTLNLVQPQPVYAFPFDLKKSAKRNQKNLLKPPLYWKIATKSLHPDGPPVFQESISENVSNPHKKIKRRKKAQAVPLKRSETVVDISSITSAKTVRAQWVKSQSLNNIFYETCESCVNNYKKNKKLKEYKKDEWHSLRSQVYPDISHGAILFTVAYFTKKKICVINIERLENLSKKGRERNSYYTVVKITILPSEKYIKCTKVLSNCSSPEVKQDFSFSMKELSGKVLRLSVFDASLQKQHEAVGHALLVLNDSICNQPKKYRIKLYRRSQPHLCPGYLCLSLNYLESKNTFTITVDKARNLSLQKERNIKLNTYVKVTLYSYGEKVKTKKSVVVMDSRDPDYNSSFTFQVRKDQIDYLSVSIAVRLKGFVNDMTIGRLNFGPYFYVDSVKLTPWGKVFLKKEFVSYWFRLYL